jgi:hypothetical protein
MEATQPMIQGHLDMYQENGTIYINGDPNGLRSLSSLLLRVANIIEEDDDDLNIGDREHLPLNPNFDISKSSDPVSIGRLEAKLTGNFYERYIPRENGI